MLYVRERAVCLPGPVAPSRQEETLYHPIVRFPSSLGDGFVGRAEQVIDLRNVLDRERAADGAPDVSLR